MIKDISESQKLDRELSLPELNSLMRRDKESAESNSTTHMSLGKVDSPTVNGCKEVQTKVETDLHPSSGAVVLILVIVLLSSVTFTIGAGWIILRTVQWIQWMAECLVYTMLDIVRVCFYPHL